MNRRLGRQCDLAYPTFGRCRRVRYQLTLIECAIRPALETAEPVVALVLPIAAGVVVLHPHRGDVFRVFEAKLGGNADFDREAVGARQDLVVEFDVSCVCGCSAVGMSMVLEYPSAHWNQTYWRLGRRR